MFYKKEGSDNSIASNNSSSFGAHDSLLESQTIEPVPAYYNDNGVSGTRVVDINTQEYDPLHTAPSTKLEFPDDINDPNVTGTIFSSSINICNTILGSGMLIMPLAMMKLGLAIGIFMISLSGFGAAYGLRILTNCGVVVGRKASFNALTKVTYRKIAVLFDIAIAVKCFGVSVSYLIICGDFIPTSIRGLRDFEGHEPFWISKQFWVIACVLSVAPFAFLRRLDALKYISTFALLSVFYLMVLVIYYFIIPTSKTGINPHRTFEQITWVRFDIRDFLNALPMIVFAFTCHQNLYAVFNELKVNTSKRMNIIINFSVAFAYICYLIVGILGYLTFPDEYMTSPHVIGQYPEKQYFVIGARLALVSLVLLAYPLQIHPSRASIDKIYLTLIRAKERRGGWTKLFSKQANYDAIEIEDPALDSTEEIPKKRWLICTVILLASSTLIACAVDSLTLVLSIVGATGSTTICYILPGLFYNKLLEHPEFYARIKATRFTKYYAKIMIGAGVFIMVSSLAGTIWGAITGH